MGLPMELFFFFQAEDGIRDLTVTGVQTCALPISSLNSRRPRSALRQKRSRCVRANSGSSVGSGSRSARARQIGRASCRERVEISVVAGSLKKKDKRG